MTETKDKTLTRALSVMNSALLAIVTFFFIQMFTDFKEMKDLAVEQRIETQRIQHQVLTLERNFRELQLKIERGQ